ncbi:unnamed protein product [Bursaphelenchus okinawaensis]|uniref:DH domain-containing protein n=1 Tax=Bursaphelenchus okinawaensis TaxID=465554 RepID=A0A811LTC0_9BILA|nr:unnamed protein product [Bursaphelenchus okinawaensis]CAG9128543.1 unnamed protein product [Bursaphelenchus okinawaensis]
MKSDDSRNYRFSRRRNFSLSPRILRRRSQDRPWIRQIEVLHEFSDFAPSTSSEVSTPVASNSPTRGMAAMELASSQQYHSHCGLPSTSKAAYVLDELLTTEKTYVRELESIVEYYVNPFENPENEKHIPEGLRGQSSVIFGNFRDLYEFHNRHVLPDFQKAQYSPVLLCHIMINFRNHFLKLYRPYCQNKPQSESVRRDQQADGCRFFAECQKKAGHQLPLSAYLLKPIQRITKYQLLLKELLRHCQDEGNEEIKHDVQAALASMLDLLAQINADMQQLHILGYAGDLRLLGPLRLQTECEVYTFKRKTRRLSNKCQKRHLFLFDGGILFCKKRTQPVPYSPEFYEHKLCIYAQNLGFAECSKQSADRFEIWDEQKSDGFAIFATDEVVRAKWIQRLAKMTVLHAQQQKEGLQQNSNSRPHSWTSESTVSSRSSNFDENQTDSLNDNNGNPSSPSSDHHSATSGSVSSRRSSSHTASLGSDAENNTPLPVSKSLQNTALLGHAVSEV